MTLKPGLLVQVIKAAPCNQKYIGERFILCERGPNLGSVRTWKAPEDWDVEVAEENCIVPVVDEGKQKRDWTDSDCVWSPFVGVS